MKLLKKIYDKINPPKLPKYGSRIFEQQTWLDKQIQEVQWKRRFLVD